ICFFDGARLRVGPKSAGADPGPACYRRGGPLTVTDCNVLLGRVRPEFFPAIFGPDANEPLDAAIVRQRFAELCAEVNAATGSSITPEEAARCLDATTWHTSMVEYFRGGGWSTKYLTRGGMPVTMFRLNLVHGLGPALQIAQGWTVDLPQAVHEVLDERTNPTWPTTWFVPNVTGSGAFSDVYNVMYNWGANHGAISYGHIGADLITLASMLRIPVYMHNVAEEQIFRPSAWNAFGAADREAADFRACANFGPLYGR
ncbi:MAG TPA: hydantoinase/oxoprolinase family protein, partial [Anaerolineae bacterium]|nr:hydantoinase/oxoprolinase family protein [Anaerolineae bacterium]